MNFFSGFGGFPFGGHGQHDEDDCTPFSTQKLTPRSTTPSSTKFWSYPRRHRPSRSKNSTESWPRSGTLTDREATPIKYTRSYTVQINFRGL